MNSKTSECDSERLKGDDKVTIERPDGEQTLAQDLALLADHVAEYNCVNAFLCKSFTAVMSPNEPLDTVVIEGARQCADTLQASARSIKDDLDRFRKRYLAEQPGADSQPTPDSKAGAG